MEQLDGDKMEMMDDLNNTLIKDANNVKPIADATYIAAFGTLDGKEFTVSKINNPSQLTPVKVTLKTTPLKPRGGDLLKQVCALGY
jgi:hypothetical protein